MVRGHQERLALMVQAVMTKAGLAFADLDRIGVTVGPGSFTGLRVGIAFAKGLGLALGKPCVGIGCLPGLAASELGSGMVAAVIDARRDQIYLQIFADGEALMAPDAVSLEVAAARLVELWTGQGLTIIGPGAALLEGVIKGARLVVRDAVDPVALARLASKAEISPPRPLYLRAPDAKLPGGLVPDFAF
jgi:tRNA threonylcarbamoyladenosine biosynthesis protein TsaB